MKTLASLAELGETKLLALIKADSGRISSAHVTLGKAVAALDAIRPDADKVPLKRYVREKTGGIEVSDMAFAVANAAGIIGTGPDGIAEADFDALPLRWLLAISAIRNALATLPDSPQKAAHAAEVARICRERPANGGELLGAIKSALKPASKVRGKGPAEAEGKQSDAEGKAEGAPVRVPTFSPAWFGALMTELLATTDAQTLRNCSKAFGEMAGFCDATLAEMAQPADARPATVAALAAAA